MGAVYRAHDPRLDRWVAVKTLSLDRSAADLLGFLQREARLAAKLRHPNIVQVYDFLPEARPPCFVMELVTGSPLLQSARKMSFKQKAVLVSKIARAVSYAHDRGVVHRDLKPGNILVEDADEPRILDFGVARRLESTAQPSQEIFGGTPLYMAPEQFLSPQAGEPTVDIYAIGLILFELLAEVPPPIPTDKGDRRAWASRVLPLPREINPGIPEPLQRICLKACEPNPGDRYPTARHLADDLDRFVADQAIAARPKTYLRLIHERAKAHLDDLALWESDGLITQREHDVLEHSYAKFEGTDSQWIPEARRLRWGPALAHLGGWLVVLSALLLPAFHWLELSPWQRIAGVGLPTLLVNVVGLLGWWRQNRLLGTVFCAVGVLLLPVFLLVLFSQLHWMEWVQPEGELLYPLNQIEGIYGGFNTQLFATFLVMLGYSTVLLWRTRIGLFSALTAISAVLAYIAAMGLLGLRLELKESHFATAACWFWPMAVISCLLAWWLDRKRLEHVASPLYASAALLFIAITSVLAIDAPISWMKLEGTSQQRIAMDFLFIGNSILYLMVALLADKSGSRLRRLTARWFYRLVPPLCVIPLDRLESPLRSLQVDWLVVFTVAGANVPQVYATEILAMMACVGFVILAVLLQWRWYMYYGLIHLAVALVVFTHMHLRDYLSWPIAVMIVGTVVMTAGAVLEIRFTRVRDSGLGTLQPK
jgi:hypothetical protein